MQALIFLFLIISAQAVAEPHFYIGGGVGKNTVLFGETEWEDRGELGCGFRVGHRHSISGNFYGDLQYSHYSQCLVGRGDRVMPGETIWYESSSDHFYYWIEYRF